MWFNSDDTALNAVSLKCVRPGSKNYEGHITSMEGFWGAWKGILPLHTGYPSILT